MFDQWRQTPDYPTLYRVNREVLVDTTRAFPSVTGIRQDQPPMWLGVRAQSGAALDAGGDRSRGCAGPTADGNGADTAGSANNQSAVTMPSRSIQRRSPPTSRSDGNCACLRQRRIVQPGGRVWAAARRWTGVCQLAEEGVPKRSKLDTLARRMAGRLSVGCAFLVGSAHHGLRPQEGSHVTNSSVHRPRSARVAPLRAASARTHRGCD